MKNITKKIVVALMFFGGMLSSVMMAQTKITLNFHTPIVSKKYDIDGRRFDLLEVKINKEEGSIPFFVEITSPKGRVIRSFFIEGDLNENIEFEHNYPYITIWVKSTTNNVPVKGNITLKHFPQGTSGKKEI